MATETVLKRPASADERMKIATEAAYEIESIARAMRELDDSEESRYLLRGWSLRLERLAGAIMTDSHDERSAVELQLAVLGKRLEVPHA